jgi:hypothetical protein
MDNSLVSFMQDIAQGVFGDADLTYKEVDDFVRFATPTEKRAVMNRRAKWLQSEEEDIDTTVLTTFVKKTIQEYFAVSE